MTQNHDLSEMLETLFAEIFPDFRNLVSVHQLSAGASQETYRITYLSNEAEVTVALRRAPPTLKGPLGAGSIGLASEARLFKLAQKEGIPSPSVLYELTPDDQLGEGFVMNWVEGETMGHRILRSDELADIRPKLARQCGEILGRIHSIDWQGAALDDFLELSDVSTLIDKVWNRYEKLNVPYPMIDYTRRWLKENIPEHGRRTLVHNDFRNGNLMIDANGVQAVLDWEIAHIGDPIQDLGWICTNSWRFGNHDLPVGGFGEISDLLEGYRSTSGVNVDENELRFWIVFGSYQWSISTLYMASTWRSGETPSLERPVIGRRSSEAQMDCANLIVPGEIELPKPLELDQGTQLPMPAELMVSVADFLIEQVAPQMDSHNRFLAKVAANSLGIAQRECLYAASLADKEAARISALLGVEGKSVGELRWKLVHELRAGMALGNADLAYHLRQTVAGQLFIDQPNYSALSAVAQ